MPIYAYLCADCGFEKDQLQKLSDPPLTDCPSCSGKRFARKLTAPAFQLKGTGWYVTDFRDGKSARKPEEAAPEKSGTEAAADGKGAEGKSGSGETASSGAGAEAGTAGAKPASTKPTDQGTAATGGAAAAPAPSPSPPSTVSPSAGGGRQAA